MIDENNKLQEHMFLQMKVDQEDVDFDFNVPEDKGTYIGDKNEFDQKHGYGVMHY